MYRLNRENQALCRTKSVLFNVQADVEALETRLFLVIGAEDAVAGITQARHNESVLVQMAIQGGSKNLNARMGFGEGG